MLKSTLTSLQHRSTFDESRRDERVRDVEHAGEHAREETRLRGDAPATSATIEEGIVVAGHECDVIVRLAS